MEQADIDYLSQSLSEMFGEFSTMLYIPLKDSKPNRYGEIIPSFDSDFSFTIYGVYSSEVNKDKDLDRKDSQSSNRIEGTIKFITRDVYNRGRKIKLGDAIDVLNEYGTFDRFIITGFDKKVELPSVITRVYVTLYDKMASE